MQRDLPGLRQASHEAAAFAIKDDLAGAARLAKLSPSDGATRVNRNARLSWQASSGATAYWVCIDTVLDGSCTSFTNGPYTGTSVRVGLSRGTSYEWDVRAINANGSTVASGGAWSFATR